MSSETDLKLARAEEAIRFIGARPIGTTLWISGYGQSMWPLFRTNDAFQIRRCSEAAIRPGDVVLVRTGTGELVLHLAVATNPLTTAPFVGAEDPGDASVLGRIEKVRRGALELPLPRSVSPVLHVARRAASFAHRQVVTRAAFRALSTVWSSRVTLPIRRGYLRDVEVRPLGPSDWDMLYQFAGDHLRIAAQFLHQQLHGRWAERRSAMGAVSRGGLVGFCWVDEYRQEGFQVDGLWIRSLYVRPIGRGMGVAQRLVEKACAAAQAVGATEVLADVEETNKASMRVFEAVGFNRAPDAIEAGLNDEWRIRGRNMRLRVLIRQLQAAKVGRGTRRERESAGV